MASKPLPGITARVKLRVSDDGLCKAHIVAKQASFKLVVVSEGVAAHSALKKIHTVCTAASCNRVQFQHDSCLLARRLPHYSLKDRKEDVPKLGSSLVHMAAEGSQLPHVLEVFTQWQPGHVDADVGYLPSQVKDDSTSRAQRFCSAVEAHAQNMPAGALLGIPWHASDKSDTVQWAYITKWLRDFAPRTHVRVTVFQTSATKVAEQQTGIRGEIQEVSQKARSYVNRRFPKTAQANAASLASILEDHLLTGLDTSESTAQIAAPVFAAQVAEAAKQVTQVHEMATAEALAEKAAQNEAVDAAFEAHVLQQLQDGEASMADVAAANVATAAFKSAAWIGSRVRLTGLKDSRFEGLTGTLGGYIKKNGRYIVELDERVADLLSINVHPQHILCTADGVTLPTPGEATVNNADVATPQVTTPQAGLAAPTKDPSL